jgi:hypothetical protein
MSKLDDQTLAPFLKKDAIVEIKISTGYLEQVGAIIPLLLEGRTQEDVSQIENLIKEKKPLEPWMAAIATLQVLIRTVFEEGDKQGFVEYRNAEEALKEELSKQLDDSPLDQLSEDKGLQS